MTVVDMNNAPLVISHRLNTNNTPPMEKVLSSHLILQEILIVGNCTDQVLIDSILPCQPINWKFFSFLKLSI